jgi:RNA polymerase sigma-70 factor, ECF subfamily
LEVFVEQEQPYLRLAAGPSSDDKLSISDQDLLRRGQTGDEKAFAGLAERHGRYLFGIARSLTNSLMDAEDVYQEALIGALTGHFRGESSVRTWMVQILVRQAALLRRKWSRWHLRQVSGPHDDPHGLLDVAVQKPGEKSADFRMDLQQVLQGLTPEFQQVIVLRELEEMSYEAIAQCLGLPQGTVESRLHRARAELRKRLSGYEG